jgi:hypothetical protein
MSDNEQTGGASELDVLKQRARLMGITFSNNIGVDALRAKIAAKVGDTPPEADVEEMADDEAEGEDAEVSEDADESVSDETAPEVNGLEAAAAIANTKDTRPHADTYRPALDHDGDGRNGGSLPRNAAPARKLTAQEQKMKDRQELMREQLKLVRLRIQNLDPKKANLPGEIFTVANRVLGTIRKFVPYGEVTEDGYHVPYIIYRQLDERKFLNIRTIRDRKTGHIRVESNWAKEFALEVLPPLTQEELDRLATAQTAAGSVNND